jgi:hypothetical protein
VALVSVPAIVCTDVQKESGASVETTSTDMPRCFLTAVLVRTACHT